MGSANKHHHGNTSKPPKNPTQNPNTSSDTEEIHQNPNPNPNLEPQTHLETESIAPFTIDGEEEDSILSKSEFLTREEVIKRRYRRLKMDIQVYEDYYWALMEDYRVKHREYYWNYGKSPFVEDEEGEGEGEGEGEKKEKSKDENGDFVEETNEISNGKLGLGIGVSENGGGGGSGTGKEKKCTLNGCKLKPMALSTFCHTHILSDTKQQLYKACTHLTKSSGAHCNKPVQRGTVPCLCAPHYEKAQLQTAQALRRAGGGPSASRIPPKFHVIIAESVREINSRRRVKKAYASKNVNNNNAGGKVLDKDENNTKTEMEED